MIPVVKQIKTTLDYAEPNICILQDIPIEDFEFEETKHHTYRVLIVDDNFFNVDVLA